MDYEKKYKEALELARVAAFNGHQSLMEGIFPELKEPEDEKVKRILHSISSKISFHLRDIFTEEEFQCFDTWSNAWLEKQGEQPKEATYTHEVETGNGNINALVTEKVQLPKFKVKYAGSEYNVFETKEIAGVTFYRIEDEQNHIDYVKAENCEIISVYAIKENGSPYPTKPAAFSEQKPAWSQEDREYMESLLDIINGTPSLTPSEVECHKDWLKKLKQRIGDKL